MEIHQLRYFVAVAERRHFTQAAQDLAVAQPSVSKQIRKLEGELGAALFQRARGEIALTQAGEALLPWAKRVLADVDGARNEVRDLAGLGRGRLSVGATPSLTTVVLPEVLARFHAEHPGIELVLHEAGSRALLERLERGDIEVALVILPAPEASFATTPLYREELVVAVARDHRFARRRSIRVADLRDVPLVMFREGYDLRAVTIAACQQAGFEPVFALEGGEMDGVLRMAAAGLGVAVVPASVIERGGALVAVRLADPPLERTVGLAHRRDWTLSPAAVRFAALFGDGSRARRRS
ncbi:MAG TPA: LysR substrate-binding domain-containing protein [Candidatus Limnocylindria bacterium]|nr:LysR substrate-binding domain-containing protein [Candidatus Limnocylindria bacterium]